jgi:hypothetical protein
MLIKNKKEFTKGVLLAISFLVVLVIMFMPLFEGHNTFVAADKLFNSIAKGSTYYIGDLIKKAAAFNGQTFDLTIKLKSQETADKAKKVFTTAGCEATGDAGQFKIKGDLGKAMSAALKDSDDMFYNRDADLKTRYGIEGKEALFTWWSCFKAMDLELKKLGRSENFKQAAFLDTVVKKGLEVGYNFFQISPQSARSKGGILSFSLIFYVIYTLWWGIAILFMFEGLGLEMKAGAKKEL